MKTAQNKRAVAYSLLAHISTSGTLINGPLDIFVPIVKKGLHYMGQTINQTKGESINEIRETILSIYDLDIPIPVLRDILKVIAKELNAKEELLILYNDDAFLLKSKYTFEDYDEFVNEKQKNINQLQTLFDAFCKAEGYSPQNASIIKFIETNRMELSHYLANKPVVNNTGYTVEAKFVDYFKSIPSVYEEVRAIYLGAMISSLLEYKPTNLNVNIDLLLDTNFIVSLLDLNTPESTHTCNKLIEISKEMGFTIHVLQDTIEETVGLLRYKAQNFDSSIIQRYVNREDIYNACERKHLTNVDLNKIADNIEKEIENQGIVVVPNTEKLRNIAKYSKEYEQLKNYRTTPKAALHDAMCIYYVKEKRGSKRITNFEEVNCWFVNNTISHDTGNDNIESILSRNNEELSEIIKVDDLLNILWLSNPSFAKIQDDFVNIGITSLIASSLCQSLPKSRIIKELDDNIKKYRNASLTERDVYMLSIRVANGQVRNIEKLNDLASTNSAAFNKAVKEEAAKQEQIELEKTRRLEEIITKVEKSLEELKEHKNQIDHKSEQQQAKHQKIISEKEEEIQQLRKTVENQKREPLRERYKRKELKKWRKKYWLWMILPVVLLGAFWIVSILFPCAIFSHWLTICIITGIISVFMLKGFYDRYMNEANINSFYDHLQIPDEYREI